MAWPPQPHHQPAPAAPKSTPPIAALVTAAAAVMTFLFSFVRIAKLDGFGPFGNDVGWSVWTLNEVPPGLFGVGTFIPVFALVAGAAALARALVEDLSNRSFGGFTLLQVQQVATAVPLLLWLGYLVGTVLGDTSPGLGLLLLFIGLAGLAAGTVMSTLEVQKAATPFPSPGGAAPPAATPTGQWPGHAAPPPDPAGWPQPAPGVPAGAEPAQWQHQPAPDPGQWPQPMPGGPVPPTPAAGEWSAPPAPGQWQPDPTGTTPMASPADPQPWAPGPAPTPAPPGPQPEPGPLDPQPAPPQPMPAPAGEGAGVLTDPGTQVIPGPPPAPPAGVDAPDTDRDEPGLPPPAPSNTP